MAGLPPLQFSLAAPTTGGNVSQQNSVGIGSGAWPFGGGNASDTWKTAAIVAGVLAILLLTHRIHLGK